MKYLKHPATIIACVALFIALGGGAAAYASGLINGSQIKNHSIAAKKLTAKALKQLKGNRGPAGPAGQQGIQGIQGIQGVPGAKGDTGPIGPSNAYSNSSSFVNYDDVGENIVTLTLPAGSYFVMGNTAIADGAFNEDTGCYLMDSKAGTLDGTYGSTATAEPGNQESMHVQAPLTTTGSTVALFCITDDSSGSAFTIYAHVSAIKVGSVSGTLGHFSGKALSPHAPSR